MFFWAGLQWWGLLLLLLHVAIHVAGLLDGEAVDLAEVLSVVNALLILLCWLLDDDVGLGKLVANLLHLIESELLPSDHEENS